MVARRPSSLFTRSTSSSPQRSQASSRSSSSQRARISDTSDKDMSSEDHHPTRPLTVSIPQASGPYCHRRPTLKEILANNSSPPWTLAAFMAYLSANLCLENLEFTMDAGRYQKHYAKMMTKAGEEGTPTPKDCEYVRLLWMRLIDAYIAPNGSREVNLPSNVRDPILNAPTTPMPPPPDTLAIAVSKTHELMEESVLQPFLNSLSPQTNMSTSWQERSLADRPTPPDPMSAHAQSDSSMFGRRKTRESPPPHAPDAAATRLAGTGRTRLTGNKSNSSGSGLSTTLSNTSDASLSKNWSGSGHGMTDDSGSTGSPINEGPMTPPMSPPVNELGSHQQSPKHNRDSGMWKRLGRLSGMKTGSKKKPHE